MQIQTNKKDLGQLIGICAVVAIVILVVMAAFGPGSKGGNAWSYLTGGSQQSQAPASGSSVVGGPSITAAKIDTILTNAGSPAAGTGQDLYNLGVQYNIDPAFAAAVFKHESNYGTQGIAHSSLSLGNLRCIPDAACVGGYAYFNSWQDGYTAFYKLIAGPLYVGAGLTTPGQIFPKYAPSEDNNNPQEYAANVENDMQTWRAS